MSPKVAEIVQFHKQDTHKYDALNSDILGFSRCKTKLLSGDWLTSNMFR